GGEPVMWKAGHSHIKTKMKELHSPLAGEMSAHIFFGHRYYGYDDALYAAIRLLSIIAESPATLADMLDAMPKTESTPEIRLDCADERKFTVVEEIKRRVAGRKDVKIFDMDGVRVESADGWWLLRASNTQAALSIRCEADTKDALARLKAEVAGHLTAVGIAPPDGFI
ncbi:MAG: phosphomannomutase, partial [Proteobacteria bacterium]|nr:phosphomannomutase [Pseudomonadota bacterium]